MSGDTAGISADLDAIRAFAALATRQAEHLAAIDDYMRRTCSAAGAFSFPSVMRFFEGGYEQALDYASEGLGIGQDSGHQSAGFLHQCANGYEAADFAAYGEFNEIAGSGGWTIAGYEAAGSGAGLLAPGVKVEMPTKAKPPEQPPALDGTLDGAIADKLDLGLKHTAGIVEHGEQAWKLGGGALAREVVKLDGELRFKDDLTRSQLEEAKTQKALAPQSDWDKTDGALGFIADPLKGARDRLADKGSEILTDGVSGRHGAGPDAPLRAPVEGQGRLAVDQPGYQKSAEQHRSARESVDQAVATYGAVTFVASLRHDRLAGMDDSWNELSEATGNHREQREAANAPADTSVRDWVNR